MLIFILLGWVPIPLLLALGVVMWLTVVELLEWRPNYGWWIWWLLLVFGVFLGPVLAALTWQVVLYAVISLVVVRTVAVAVSMVGEGMRRPTILYMGWFGPRGLATIILTIEIIGESDLRGGTTIADAALLTVGLSVLLHGATAWWGSNAYADYVETHPKPEAMPERRVPAVSMKPVEEQARYWPRLHRSLAVPGMQECGSGSDSDPSRRTTWCG